MFCFFYLNLLSFAWRKIKFYAKNKGTICSTCSLENQVHGAWEVTLCKTWTVHWVYLVVVKMRMTCNSCNFKQNGSPKHKFVRISIQYDNMVYNIFMYISMVFESQKYIIPISRKKLPLLGLGSISPSF